MNKIPRSAIVSVVEFCMGVSNVHEPAKSAVKYLAPDLVVKATRKYRLDRRCKSDTLILTYGKPNYAEREFIKKCKKAGEPLPVRGIQVKWYPGEVVPSGEGPKRVNDV
jgi:hypothetical protein